MLLQVHKLLCSQTGVTSPVRICTTSALLLILILCKPTNNILHKGNPLNSFQVWRFNPDQWQRIRQLSWCTISHESGTSTCIASPTRAKLDRQRLPPTSRPHCTNILSSQFQRRSSKSILWLRRYQSRKCYHQSRSASRLGQLELHQYSQSSRDGW